ncbi:MAG: hypothetical protein KBD51_00645 [Candidatus Levybacteria bacterium]|nr:hypothetical protein [Candidatus Levybacteria bacterium]
MSKARERGTIHLPPSKTPREHQGAHYTLGKPAASTLTDAQVEQELLASFGIHQSTTPTEPAPNQSSTPPVFGVDSIRSPEQPGYLTVGIDTWLWNGPRWDPTRERLGRADKPTSGLVLQRVEDPRDAQRPKNHRRVSIEIAHTYTGKDGTTHTSRFWVNPKRGGFEGMPAKGISRPTLGLGKQVKSPQE